MNKVWRPRERNVGPTAHLLSVGKHEVAVICLDVFKPKGSETPYKVLYHLPGLKIQSDKNYADVDQAKIAAEEVINKWLKDLIE